MLKNPISLDVMILFSSAKINIGLQIVERRKDGFHNLQSVMHPVGLHDILEIRKSPAQYRKHKFTQSGIQIDRTKEPNNPRGQTNLCVKALKLFDQEVTLPWIEMHLHKNIPVGAGLGGGSSNASVTLRGLNKLMGDPLPMEKLLELAANLGSDCPFFLHHKPMLMEGRGEKLSEIDIDLHAYYIALLFPNIHISTVEAYKGVQPSIPGSHIRELINQPLALWNENVLNDFEPSVFARYPELGMIKNKLYEAGAIYASLSGSGAAIYGIFPSAPLIPPDLEQHVIWKGKAIT